MRKRMLWGLVLAAPVIATIFIVPLFAAPQPAVQSAVPPEVVRWGFVTAALAAGLSALGAAYAVAVVGAAAMGAVAEKPEVAGRALVFVGLAEGIAIYGLIIAIMILGRLG
ncbi:MAG TPA: ATP synthase subunit C [Thermoanaerobaculia bacterium]